MAFANAQQSRVLIGPRSYAGETKSITAKQDVMALDVTTLVDTAKKFIVGQDTSTFALDLFLDSDASVGGEWDTLNTHKALYPGMALSYAPRGFALGSETWLVSALALDATTTNSGVGAAVTAKLSTQTDGPHDYGLSLLDVSAITTAAGVTNQTGVDNGAATANGGVAHLHVSAFATYTNDTFRVEHSTDNISFATLGTFTVVTGTTYQRLVIAAGTTVNRYVRASETTTGSTGSITRQMSFARR